MVVACGLSGEGQRNPEIRRLAVQFARPWHYADYGVGRSIQQNRPANERRIAAEQVLPETVRQYGNLLAAGLVFVSGKGPATRGLYAKNIEVRRRDGSDSNGFRLIAAGITHG